MAVKNKRFRPAVVALSVPLVLMLVFLVLFVDTCMEYGRVREFREEMRSQPFAHNNLNKYKKMLGIKRQKLDALRRSVSIRFRPSSFKKRVEEMARLSGIPENNVSIERFRFRKGGDYQKLLIEVKVRTSFPALGAFLSRLETITVRERDRFAYVLRVRRVDIAVVKLYSRTLSARLHLTVFRKGGS